MGRTSADAVAGFTSELLFDAALLALARRELPPWGIEEPVMDAISDDLQSLGLRHVDASLGS